ncbi:hypothetical protein OA86_15025 [Kaistella jeonii]|uniref:Uncharacterized protein n=1 Tax=Kaistella jeonii TaxID=266749 RepID=A0A0C1EN92_9FLAO|nr:hypothetical protein OA86_15025 [Kaistella jeonii]
MAQIYYFCFNYLGVPFFLPTLKSTPKKRSVSVQSLFSAAAKPTAKKELQQCTSPSRKIALKIKVR